MSREAKGPFLVLANSNKESGRCLALVDRSGQWLRPVSRVGSGELRGNQQANPVTGDPLLPLDVVDAAFSEAKPEPHQPEDWTCPVEWALVTGSDKEDLRGWLETAVNHEADFLSRGRPDRISDISMQQAAVDTSLTVVRPDQVMAYKEPNPFRPGLRKRLRFSANDIVSEAGAPIQFDLGLTDPIWIRRLLQSESEEMVIKTPDDASQAYVTVSLGGLFDGAYYKIAAALITEREIEEATLRLQ